MLIGTDQIDVNSKNKCGDTPLHLAAREGHANVVQALLACKNIEKEADVNIQDTNGDTALHLAIDGKHLDVVKRLVQEEKLNLNIKNKQNRTFLYLANKSDNVEIVNAIRAAIKDIDEQVMKDLKDKENHFSIERIKYWLGKGLLNIDARDGEDARSTLLMHAAKNNDASAVKFLIDQGASVNEQDKDGDAALHIATRRSYEYEYEYENVVKLLLEARGNVNVNLQNDKRDAALHIAAYNGFENIVNMLLKEKEIDVNLKGEAGDTALSQAAYRGHAGVVKLLLQVENIDVNRQGNNEKTPLLLAAQKYYSEIVKVLLESGKNIDIGPTLDWAKRDDHASAIVTLLETYQKNKERENSVS